MKNITGIIFTIGIISLFTNCNSNTDTVTIPKTEYNQLKGIPLPIKPEYPKIIKMRGDWNNLEIKIRLIDGCEYFTYHVSTNAGIMCHKGNCKFCQQRLEQTIRKIVQKERQ
jgi:hypothetical protein